MQTYAEAGPVGEVASGGPPDLPDDRLTILNGGVGGGGVDGWMVTRPGCIPASRLTAGTDSTLMTLTMKCHTRRMEMMLRAPDSLVPD